MTHLGASRGAVLRPYEAEASGENEHDRTCPWEGGGQPKKRESANAVTVGVDEHRATCGASGPSIAALLASPRRPGEIGRLGDYSVWHVLGVGGTGVVFEATDVHRTRTVALKAFRTCGETGLRARFVREAQATAAVLHPHLVPIYQVGEGGPAPFLVMPLLRGHSLQQRLHEQGRLLVGQVLWIARQVALGLEAMHRHGLLHRDIKPGNIWLERAGDQVRILDLGPDLWANELLAAGIIFGTPKYMAPEQVRGEKVDPRCDLFSLGVVMYQAATAREAFCGASAQATLLSVVRDRPPAPHELHPGIPAKFSALVMRLLEKDRAKRFPTAADVVGAIDGIECQAEDARSAPPARNWTSG